MKLSKRIEALAEAREECPLENWTVWEDEYEQATFHIDQFICTGQEVQGAEFVAKAANEIIHIRDEFREFVSWVIGMQEKQENIGCFCYGASNAYKRVLERLGVGEEKGRGCK